MNVLPLAAFAASLTPRSRLMALDLGTTTIGLAVASWPDGIATPGTTIRRTKFRQDAAELLQIIHNERITHLVLGLPMHMGGEEGRRAQATRAFARNLAPFTPPPILLFDERLTSAEAEDRMRAEGLSAVQRAERIDAYAAAIILEDAIGAIRASFLDGMDA